MHRQKKINGQSISMHFFLEGKGKEMYSTKLKKSVQYQTFKETSSYIDSKESEIKRRDDDTRILRSSS